MYRITDITSGFGTQTKEGIELSVGAQLTVNFQLVPGAVETTEAVNAAAESEVNATSAEQSALIDQRQMRELPLCGRNFEQLILLAQGAHLAPATQVGSFYGRSGAYSISGTRPEGQLVLLDGCVHRHFVLHCFVEWLYLRKTSVLRGYSRLYNRVKSTLR